MNEELEMKVFKYLETIICASGEMEEVVSHRVNVSWLPVKK